MINNLVNISDFAGYLDISENINNEQLLINYISRAQLDERKYWTNDHLFSLLIANPTEARFIDLLSGKTYTDLSGNIQIFEGIKPQIIFWTGAKLAKSGFITHTDMGYSISLAENNRKPLDSENKAFYFELRNRAIRYEADTIRFLESNTTVYPEWNYEYLLRNGTLGLYK